MVDDVSNERSVQVGVTNEFSVEVEARKRKHSAMLLCLLSSFLTWLAVVNNRRMGVNEDDA
jgi:hypothetical protein